MGEAILTRIRDGGNDFSIPNIPASSGVHKILARVLWDNIPTSGIQVSCLAGGRNYYNNTNTSGMCLFSINASNAKVWVNNIVANNQYLDYSCSSYVADFDTPLGNTTTINLEITNGDEIQEFWQNAYYNFRLFRDRDCDITLCGGGGGGGGGCKSTRSDDEDRWHGGGGGGGGYINFLNERMNSGNYQLQLGSGGLGSTKWGNGTNGSTGGTSLLKYENNGILSALGGGGGGGNVYHASGGIGGSGNGAIGSSGNNGENSNYVFGGGGGGGSENRQYGGSNKVAGKGGSPGGGNGGTGNRGVGTSGIKGGGGGGGCGYNGFGGSGGMGACQIKIYYG